jgi:NAD(P)-dependent dehydrogenase (short-subunit alcohol dehydrogenase family)
VNFRQSVVLVTGATSGIGAATARAFAGRGARVMLSGRSERRGRHVMGEIAAGGHEASFLAGDVREAAFCRHLVDETVDRLGRLDVLVNNAGVSRPGTVEEIGEAEWRETLTVNLDAAFHLSRAAVPVMKRQGGGAIVNIASDWGLVAGERAVAYCASKGALVQLTRAMALDHAREGIRINAVCPSETDTPMLDSGGAHDGVDPQERRRIYAEALPIGRIATPDEIARVVVFLASDDASFMTGAAVPVDGGATAH